MGRKERKPETVYERGLRELREQLGSDVVVVGNLPSRPHVALTAVELESFNAGAQVTIDRLRAKYGRKEG